jgi:8-oxo-dGTP diphosphatase
LITARLLSICSTAKTGSNIRTGLERRKAMTKKPVDNPSTALFEVTLTAFIVDDERRFLILKRSPNKKRFPGLWTIPGGKLETTDFASRPKDTSDYWYNVAEEALRREIKEETGLDVSTGSMGYVTSLAAVFGDSNSFVQSFLLKYEGGEITLQEEECVEYVWVNLEEAEGYELIDGIYDEMVMADRKLKGQDSDWQRFN